MDDGAELACSVAGDGPTVVLAHCWMGGREVWAPVAHRLLRRGHRVVLYDQRGHGQSTIGSDGFSIPRLGADLRAVLEAVDARDAVLAGHSMGGMTIMSLATHHLDVLEQRAKALVLVSTAASGLSRGRGDAAAVRLIGSRRFERALASPVGHALLRGNVGAVVRRDDLVAIRDLIVSCPPDVRRGWLSAMQTMDLRDGIRRASVRTTVMVGSRDTLTKPGRSADLVEALPNAELVTVRDAGHFLPLEHPDEVAGVIAAAVHDRPLDEVRADELVLAGV